MSDDFWPVFNRSMLESLAGPVAFNWLGMGWAQYQRSKQGTTDFTSSDNLTAMGINFAYNMFSIGFTWQFVQRVYRQNYGVWGGAGKYDDEDYLRNGGGYSEEEISEWYKEMEPYCNANPSDDKCLEMISNF